MYLLGVQIIKEDSNRKLGFPLLLISKLNLSTNLSTDELVIHLLRCREISNWNRKVNDESNRLSLSEYARVQSQESRFSVITLLQRKVWWVVKTPSKIIYGFSRFLRRDKTVVTRCCLDVIPVSIQKRRFVSWISFLNNIMRTRTNLMRHQLLRGNWNRGSVEMIKSEGIRVRRVHERS